MSYSSTLDSWKKFKGNFLNNSKKRLKNKIKRGIITSQIIMALITGSSGNAKAFTNEIANAENELNNQIRSEQFKNLSEEARADKMAEFIDYLTTLSVKEIDSALDNKDIVKANRGINYLENLAVKFHDEHLVQTTKDYREILHSLTESLQPNSQNLLKFAVEQGTGKIQLGGKTYYVFSVSTRNPGMVANEARSRMRTEARKRNLEVKGDVLRLGIKQEGNEIKYFVAFEIKN